MKRRRLHVVRSRSPSLCIDAVEPYFFSVVLHLRGPRPSPNYHASFPELLIVTGLKGAESLEQAAQPSLHLRPSLNSLPPSLQRLYTFPLHDSPLARDARWSMCGCVQAETAACTLAHSVSVGASPLSSLPFRAYRCCVSVCWRLLGVSDEAC